MMTYLKARRAAGFERGEEEAQALIPHAVVGEAQIGQLAAAAGEGGERGRHVTAPARRREAGRRRETAT